MFKTVVIFITALLAALSLSLTCLIAGQGAAPHPKRKSPLVASAIVQEATLKPTIDFEVATKSDIKSFCLSNLENTSLLKKALVFYEKEWRDGQLRLALSEALLHEADQSLLSFWYEEILSEAEKESFLQELFYRAQRIWESERVTIKAESLLRFASHYDHVRARQVVKVLFYHALQGDDTLLMSSLIPLMRAWQLEPRGPASITTSNNFLADALFSLQERRLEEAYTRLELALFMNENNPRALKLLTAMEKHFSDTSDDQRLKLALSP